jgi:hypothetical protein
MFIGVNFDVLNDFLNILHKEDEFTHAMAALTPAVTTALVIGE